MVKKTQTKELPVSYVKSPFSLIKAPADWNIIESKILIAVSIQLQDRFQNNGQLSLFTDDEFMGHDEVEIKIPIKDVCTSAKHYDQIDDACKRISSIIVPVPTNPLDPNDRSMEYRQLFVAGYNATVNNEEKYQIHIGKSEDEQAENKSPWKRGLQYGKYITIKVHKKISDTYFRSGSFALHLRSIASNCKCSYTPHLYMYLSKFRDYHGEVTLSYEELRKMMGMYRLNNDGVSVRIDKETGKEVPYPEGMYPRFKDFKKRVIEPAKNELDKLLDEEKVDISFVYEPVYADGSNEGRGNPSKIHFTVVKRVDEKMEAGITQALTPFEAKARELWKALLTDLGVDHVNGVQPASFDDKGLPTFDADSQEAWSRFYNNVNTVQFWKKHYGNVPGVPYFINHS